MSQPSTLNAQILIDYARLFPWTTASIGVSGYSQEPAISFLDDIVKKIMAKANPWKWNMIPAPAFYTQPYQQDYPTSIPQGSMGWLHNCTMIDINNATALPPVQPPINCVQNLLPTSQCGYPSKINWLINSMAITGVWPGPDVTYVNPLVSQGGGPASNPLTAITDPNGNIQVVTTYGATGSVQPIWPAALSAPGTITQDGGVQWTLIDPNGITFRLDRLATFNSNVWQILPVYQNKPPNIVSLKQTIAPIPDDLSYLVKQGFLAYCYKQVDNAKFAQEFQQWMQDIQEAMGASDREYQEFGFAPQQSLAGGGPTTGGYGFPGWQGWTSDGN
jgi:hypothetical protein